MKKKMVNAITALLYAYSERHPMAQKADIDTGGHLWAHCEPKVLICKIEPFLLTAFSPGELVFIRENGKWICPALDGTNDETVALLLQALNGRFPQYRFAAVEADGNVFGYEYKPVPMEGSWVRGGHYEFMFKVNKDRAVDFSMLLFRRTESGAWEWIGQKSKVGQ